MASAGGEDATAVVLAAHDVADEAVTAADLPSAPAVVDITLDITRSDGTGYTAVIRISFSRPERRAQLATVGTRLPVRIDPAIEQSRSTRRD